MYERKTVALLLRQAGIRLSADELDRLAEAYPVILEWEDLLNGMLKTVTEPATVFRGKEESPE